MRDPQHGTIHVICSSAHSSIPSSYNVLRFMASLLRVEVEEELLSLMIVDQRHHPMDLISNFGIRLMRAVARLSRLPAG